MIVDSQLAAMIKTATTWILPIIFAVTFHEAAHGFVARLFGDDTATRAGRVTFNPIAHIDPVGTILLPGIMLISGALSGGSGFLFGYAKPVPVNFGRLKPLRLGMVAVALAGPGTNVLLAILSSLLFFGVRFLPNGGEPFRYNFIFILARGIGSIPSSPAVWAAANLANFVVLNAVLCVFNLLPLPPLDGGRVAVGLLPRALAMPLARLEPYGMMILMGLFLLSYLGPQIGLGFSPLGWLIGVPADLLIRFVLTITGHG